MILDLPRIRSFRLQHLSFVSLLSLLQLPPVGSVVSVARVGESRWGCVKVSSLFRCFDAEFLSLTRLFFHNPQDVGGSLPFLQSIFNSFFLSSFLVLKTPFSSGDRFPFTSLRKLHRLQVSNPRHKSNLSKCVAILISSVLVADDHPNCSLLLSQQYAVQEVDAQLVVFQYQPSGCRHCHHRPVNRMATARHPHEHGPVQDGPHRCIRCS